MVGLDGYRPAGVTRIGRKPGPRALFAPPLTATIFMALGTRANDHVYLPPLVLPGSPENPERVTYQNQFPTRQEARLVDGLLGVWVIEANPWVLPHGGTGLRQQTLYHSQFSALLQGDAGPINILRVRITQTRNRACQIVVRARIPKQRHYHALLLSLRLSTADIIPHLGLSCAPSSVAQ